MCYFRHIGLLDDQQETSESQMNCSLRMSPELSDEQRNKLSELLRKFSGLFTKTDKSTAAKTNVKHSIFTGDHAPINQRAYRVSPTERRIIHEEVQKMLDEGIVQPSESPWSSPVVLVLKRWKHLTVLRKHLLRIHTVLGMYDERASTEIHTDASGYGIGAVLVQIQNNVEKVIAYASRTLTKPKRIIPPQKGNVLPSDPSGRLARWTLRLQEHDFDVKYKTGKKHSDADALSRNSVEEETETPDKFLAVTTSMNLAMEQKKKRSRPCEIKTFEQLIQKNEEFRFIDGILCRKNFDPDGKLWLPVIPKHLRADILRHFHDAPTAGHLGFAKTYDKIRKRFYWPGMYRNVVRYVMHCRECQRRKSVPQRPPGRLVPIPPAIAPFHRIGIDLLGRFPKHGAPRVIITDRGAVFRSRLVSSLVDLRNIDHRFTTAYHPQTNGLKECFNKTLADMLSMYVDVEQKNWDEILPFVTFAYNTAKQETTGFTPFYLLHGREAETTLDTMLPFCPNDFDNNNITKIAARAEESRQLARVHTLRAQDKDRRCYDSKDQMVSYAPGDLVWIYTPVRKSVSPKTLKKCCLKGMLETGGVMGQCVQLWTRNYGALDQTARVCFGVLCANRTREVKRDFVDLRIRRSEGRVVNTHPVV
ncbi:hypothetical protein TNCV_11951 [Trichonephila clavipes]|nr:hypothetical protein TNCV_11951 [Trichonephila clavipes]